jgi:hypothetical protein
MKSSGRLNCASSIQGHTCVKNFVCAFDSIEMRSIEEMLIGFMYLQRFGVDI